MTTLKEVDSRVLALAKKLDKEGIIRINKFNHGNDFKQVADEVIEEITLLNEYRITVEWFELSCLIRKAQ